MSIRSQEARARALFDADEIQGVLSGKFYTGAKDELQKKRKLNGKGDKPAHYKVICISMYNEDISRLDQLVESLKAKGYTKASRSALIRAALDQVDLDKIPRGI